VKEKTALILLSILFTIVFIISNIIVEWYFYGNYHYLIDNNLRVIEILIRFFLIILFVTFCVLATVRASKKISEKQQIEKQLIKEQNILQKYFDISGFIIIMMDKNLKIKLMNRKFI